MDGLREFLSDLKRHGYARGNFLGLLNVLIGRRIQAADGTVISTGIPWRTLADWLKRLRWDKDVVREVGIDPDTLPPRDRLRYWYLTIAHANVGSPEATLAGDGLAVILRKAGYTVSDAPKPKPEGESESTS
jgi:hypothetical protein